MTNFRPITGPARPEYKMAEAEKMVGKTIERIEFGEQKESKHHHKCEILNIYFTDKTALTIQIGSNVINMLNGESGQINGKTIRANDFSTDLMLFWATQKELKEEGYLK